MRTQIVLTLTGSDRIGIVETVTKRLLELDGNVETSRMARLGGEFAMLMLFTVPDENLAGLSQAVQQLNAQGFTVTAIPTKPAPAEAQPAGRPYQIDVQGADHEGIINEIAHHLSQNRINIESLETGLVRAPISGSPLFTMSARVLVPPDLPGQSWEAELGNLEHRLDVDISITALDLA